MKTNGKIFLLAITVILLNTITLVASNDNQSIISNKTHKEIVRQSTQKNLFYPQQAKNEGKEGFVLVSFTYNKDGSIQILELNTNDNVFGNYIKERLSAIPTCVHAKKEGNIHQMRFDFKLL